MTKIDWPAVIDGIAAGFARFAEAMQAFAAHVISAAGAVWRRFALAYQALDRHQRRDRRRWQRNRLLRMRQGRLA